MRGVAGNNRTGMPRLRPLHDVVNDDRGVIGPMVAVLGAALLAATGLALDVGLYYSGNRELRVATEAAALAAAMDPADAQGRAARYLQSNGYDASVLKGIEVGYYCADDDLKAAGNSGSRFVASGSFNGKTCAGSVKAPNAVRLTTGTASRQFLSGVLGSASPIPLLAASASAARIDEAGVAITSDILRLTEGGITASLVDSVNGLLGGLLGLKLTLSPPDIRALMAGNVDAGRFFDALAKRTGKTGTYGELMNYSYGMRDIALAGADAAYVPATAAALSTFGALANNSYQVPFSEGGIPLFGVGVWKNMKVGEADVRPSLRAGLNAYQLIAFAAQAGPGAIDLSDLVSVAVPGSTVKVAAVANGARSQPRFAFGPAGETSVSTSKVRLQVNLGLGDLSVLGSTLQIKSVPVLIDIAPATASIPADGIDCLHRTEQSQETRVKVNTTSGLVKAYIAEVPPSAMTKQMPLIEPISPASLISANVALLGINVASVKATAQVVAGDVTGKSDQLYFGQNSAGVVGTPSTPGKPVSLRNGSRVGETIGNLVGGVAGGLDVKVTALGGFVDLSLIKGTVIAGLLQGITTPLSGLVGTTVDPLLDNLLAALGIQLGDSTVWVTGARCGVPVLI